MMSTAVSKMDSGSSISTNNNNTEPLMGCSRAEGPSGVLSFYNGATVFLTGGTGFVGKAIVEKLLRTCEDVDTIFLLMRPKRGLNVEQRFKELMKNLIFDTIRSKRPELLDKVKPVQGDVSFPKLGMSLQDAEVIEDKVNIVIHSAATVRFIEPLSDALQLNTQGTKNVMEMCCSFKKLKSVVHVSTAYSNANKKDVEEKIYKTTYDPETLLQCVNSLPKETVDAIATTIQDGHPNTYTFTKALGETIVQRYYGRIPVTIVRPSIVTAAYNEPYNGWIDNIFGVTGLAMEIYRGTLRTGYINQNNIMDIVPVDFVVNTCITAAWHHTTKKSSEIMVYNCTSGQVNPFMWHDFVSLTQNAGRAHPSKYVMLYPNFHFTNNRLMNTFWEMVTHLFPSFVFDIWLRAQGKKPIMLKIARRFKMAMVTGEFFACRQWNFSNVNMKNMLSDMSATGESAYFPFDFACIDWEKYMNDYLMGVRKYVLKDSMDSMPAARRKVKSLYVVHKCLHILTGYYIFKILFGKR